MTYTDRYNVIIHYFQRHPVDKKKIYCEQHHIQPKSCGGSNKKDNLVYLPAAWHYRVHCYLPFVMQEHNDYNGYVKMMNAWQRFLNSSSKKIDLLKINENCLEYKFLREAIHSIYSIRSKNFHKENPDLYKGNKNPMANRHWYKDPNDKTKSLAIKEGDPVPEGWIPGHWHNSNLETKEKISNIRKGKISITDGKHAKIVNSLEEIPEGWYRGIPERSLEARQKMSKSAIAQGKRYREKHAPIWREKLRPMLECYFSEGFEAVKEKFGYKYTSVNLCQLFRKYLPEEYNTRKSPGKKHKS